eukprot:357392-Chlamydomonas_euryale.AAC.45
MSVYSLSTCTGGRYRARRCKIESQSCTRSSASYGELVACADIPVRLASSCMLTCNSATPHAAVCTRTRTTSAARRAARCGVWHICSFALSGCNLKACAPANCRAARAAMRHARAWTTRLRLAGGPAACATTVRCPTSAGGTALLPTRSRRMATRARAAPQCCCSRTASCRPSCCGAQSCSAQTCCRCRRARCCCARTALTSARMTFTRLCTRSRSNLQCSPPLCVKLYAVFRGASARPRLPTCLQASFSGYVATGTLLNNYAHIFDLLIRLRQAVCHPYLVVHSATAPPARGAAPQLAAPQPAEELLASPSGGGAPAEVAVCGVCHEDVEDAVTSECGCVCKARSTALFLRCSATSLAIRGGDVSCRRLDPAVCMLCNPLHAATRFAASASSSTLRAQPGRPSAPAAPSR